ncbi:MAG TPA: squalene synthase HpnC [Burkholderiales bacterium]|nr:squalene synthase HpnC [Burkholderiales bacterium]
MAVDHYENFPVASVILPARFRRPVALIYRFAREADDFADEGNAPAEVRLAQLAAFGEQLARLEHGQPPELAWFSELGEVIRTHGLPYQLFHDLLSAFSQDVVKTRYADYPELLDYCRRSADPVGRLLLTLYGKTGGEALRWSDAICSSLQIINFLQDVAVDYRKHRIYLPQEDLDRFGVTEEDIGRGAAGARWQALMAFEIERARSLLFSGAPLGRALAGRLGLELRMIVAGGSRILDKIAHVRGDVFRRRPVLKAHDWPLMLVHALALGR